MENHNSEIELFTFLSSVSTFFEYHSDRQLSLYFRLFSLQQIEYIIVILYAK